MERYFEKFATIQYSNTAVKNITQRTVMLNSVYNDPTLYYPYDIRSGERPDNIADRYYNDQYMAWILYLSNKVVDPYYDWYVDNSTFQDFIVKKYGSLANATSKIKYYRNNWYLYPDPIPSSTYDNLNADLIKFYEPVPINGVIVPNPSQYTRKKEDWTVSTNRIASYTANSSNFITDEVVNINFSTSQTGTGQVQFANSTTVVLQHLQGFTTNGSITGTSYLYGRESQTNVVFTATQSLANNIPSTELSYWSPVTYYDYENEINERNKSILVLQKRYSSTMSNQLKTLLR
jgi:hypothetical protein